MKNVYALVVLLLFVGVSLAQNPPAQSAAPARTDVYHVHFAKAAPGKAAAMADYLKSPDPKAPMPGHLIVLRHQEGDDWDYVAIEHLGTKATVDAAGTPPPPNVQSMGSWHDDTFAAGPSWTEFSRALGISPDAAAKTAGAVYVVSVFRAVPGQRQQLEKALTTGPGSNPANTVLLQHLEGGPWQYLTLTRYNSWQDFATDEANSVADMRKGQAGQSAWYQMRDYASFHRDTVTDRIVPAAQEMATK